MSDLPRLPDSMLACVYRERGRIDVEQVPLPSIGRDEVLLRVSHCGVCGTDLHMVMDGWGRPDSIGGHEYSGEIVAVGEAVSRLRVGDRVVGGPSPGCGRCEPCRLHRPSLCTGRGDIGVDDFQGAFAEFKSVGAAEVLAVPASLSLRDAALCEPLAVALYAITLSGIRPDESALITGAGPIGALVLAALVAIGIEDVDVVEPSPARRALASRLGARRVAEPRALEVPPMPFTNVEGACHHVFECSGKRVAVEAGLAQLRRAGTLVLVGTGMDRPRLDTNRVILNELRVTGAFNYDENGFGEALALLDSGKLPTEALIEAEDVTLDSLQGAMESLVAGRIAGKVLVVPRLRV